MPCATDIANDLPRADVQSRCNSSRVTLKVHIHSHEIAVLNRSGIAGRSVIRINFYCSRICSHHASPSRRRYVDPWMVRVVTVVRRKSLAYDSAAASVNRPAQLRVIYPLDIADLQETIERLVILVRRIACEPWHGYVRHVDGHI